MPPWPLLFKKPVTAGGKSRDSWTAGSGLLVRRLRAWPAASKRISVLRALFRKPAKGCASTMTSADMNIVRDILRQRHDPELSRNGIASRDRGEHGHGIDRVETGGGGAVLLAGYGSPSYREMLRATFHGPCYSADYVATSLEARTRGHPWEYLRNITSRQSPVSSSRPAGADMPCSAGARTWILLPCATGYSGPGRSGMIRRCHGAKLPAPGGAPGCRAVMGTAKPLQRKAGSPVWRPGHRMRVACKISCCGDYRR